MSLNVYIDNFRRDDWEQYAKEFADYSIYQTWPYQQVRGEIDTQEVSRFLIKDKDDHVLTMGQIRIKHVKILGLRIGYIQRGPLLRHKNGTVKCTVKALRNLLNVYLGTKVNVLRIAPNICNDETDHRISEMLIASGFQHVSSVAPYRTLMLQVDDSEDAVRKRLHKSFRRDIKYAEKNGIEIREGNNEEFCKILEELYFGSLKRKSFKGLNPQEFIRPQLDLSASEKMNIIVAYYDGEPVSMLLSSNLGDTAVVLLAAGNERSLSCGSSYLTWYRGAVSALHAGMKLYDLGGIDPRRNPTVYQFKKRMGADECYFIGEFEATSNLFVKHIWRIAEKAYRFLKK